MVNYSRIVIASVITIMVVASPTLMFLNPIVVFAAITGNSNRIDSSNYHSTPLVPDAASPSSSSTPPPTLNHDEDFTIQAALSGVSARPTNNIVNTNSFYDVVFVTSTSGAIKSIQVTFPAGTTIPSSAFFNEAEKCVPGGNCTEITGTASKSGQTITYTITNAVNVPAGTKIRLEFANINNPLNPSANYKVTVTTRNAANTPIDGSTQSTAYTMKQIGKNAIANNAITTPKIADNSITATKPAESFMKRVSVEDTPAGHAVGWNPNDADTLFTILEPEVVGFDFTFVGVVVDSAFDVNHFCDTVNQFTDGRFTIACSTPPSEEAFLDYIVVNLPPHVIR
jgi:hypothetical protein